MEISAVVLTKNEEKNIQACLESLSWCSEIIVIDDNSADETALLARKHGTTVYSHSLDNDFSQQRNFALTKAKYDWVLFVDADERVSGDLKKEIEKSIEHSQGTAGFFLKREDTMWGKVLNHGEQGNIQLLRLAKKGSGKWVGKVHEVWDVKSTTQQLENPIYHFPHPTVAQFLAEINMYSTIRAKELHNQGKKADWLSVLLYAKGKFAQDYFFKFGFLDGTEGFLVAIIMSFYSFLVRGKLWQLGEKS